ncbi:hypothetical protein QBC46DRAFT_454028 [Diplogelasinospora grovesii]|uniref:Nephrocystin 3-like N-terminal domain-containing protein n=1 Tax=Diplogelasinospora grovesii TaxID=303347 RepID=A0AAN6RZB8_9PEZI|nr:hypothetical protein QBC46DRAFT_454028 [Diplogelasinospora grovesii]
MSFGLCCNIWRRGPGGKPVGRSEAGGANQGSGPEACAANGLIQPQIPRTPDAVSDAKVPPEKEHVEKVEAWDESMLPKPYANTYDLWGEALELLKLGQSESHIDIVDIVEAFAGGLDRNSGDKKGLAADIQEKRNGELKGQQHDSWARCIIEGAVSVLSKLVSVGDVARIDSKDRLEVLEWISPVLYGKHHGTVKSARTAETCEWLIDHQALRKWQNSSSAILWLWGNPGTGKTFLASKVINHVESLLENSTNQEGFAYFYCDRNDDSRRNPVSVLRSYVRQLSTPVRSRGHIRKQLWDLCREARLRGRDLDLDECKGQLLESVNLYSSTTLVLDALDECDENSRIEIVTAIDEIFARAQRPLKVFISSRPDGDIRTHLASRPNIEIHAANSEDDIGKFVREEISKYRRWGPMSPQLKEDIVKTIKEVLEAPTEEDKRNKLGKLPVGLKEAYDEIYNQISGYKFAKLRFDRACMWVMSASRPLGSHELLAAIRAGSGIDDPVLEPIKISDFSDLCRNLLVLDTERDVWRFSHLSVMEYFEQNH